MDSIITKFQGIMPRFDPDLPLNDGVAWARTAQNIDLSSGKIKAVYDNLLIESDINHYNSLSYHHSAWERGSDRYFCPWKFESHELLFYLKSGVLYKKVDGVEGKVGQTRLVAPTIALNGVGLLTGDFQYIITTTRNIGGHVDESGPSAVSVSLTAVANKILITRPAITDSNVTSWTIYRLSTAGGEYLLVADIPVATETYDDNIEEANLGISVPSWYTSDQGNEIVFDIPPEGITGLAPEPHAGMLFFWIGPTLYWTEPGYPDGYVVFYSMNFPSNIKMVIPFLGVTAVLTEKGPYRVDGTNPELLQQSTLLGNHPCIGIAACKTQIGIIYLSDAGIANFTLSDTAIISENNFTEKWFKDHVSSVGALMIESDNVLYLFHSSGVLVVDLRVDPPIWTTRSIIAYAVYRKDDEGNLYVIDANGIQKLEGSPASLLAWTWRSGNILMSMIGRKEFTGVEFVGEGGDIVADLYLDGTRKQSKGLDFDMERDRTLKMPETEMGRALQINLSGSGEITEVIGTRFDE